MSPDIDDRGRSFSGDVTDINIDIRALADEGSEEDDETRNHERL